MSEPTPELVKQIESDLAALRRRRGKWFWMRFGTLLCVLLGAVGLWFGKYVHEAREASRISSCKCGLKQFGLAFHNYHDVHGCFPPAVVLGPDGSPWHS